MRHKEILRFAAFVCVYACGPAVEEPDGPTTFRACMPVVASGTTADGEQRRSDYDRDRTDELCLCATDEELGDWNEDGYRGLSGDSNAMGFDRCLELAERARLVEHDCSEKFEQNWWGLHLGVGENGEFPECGEDDDAGGCQS